jgi:Flp pilus assembly protein TadD
MSRHILMAVISLAVCTGCTTLRVMAPSADTLSPAEHIALGKAYLSKGDKKLAARQFQAATDRDSKNLTAWLALGNIAFEDGNYPDAEAYFQKAVDASPRNPAAVNNLAMTYLATGKELKNIDVMVETALEAAGPMTPYLLDTLVRIDLREGRFADARYVLDKASKTAPNDAEFRKHLDESRQKLDALLS